MSLVTVLYSDLDVSGTVVVVVSITSFHSYFEIRVMNVTLAEIHLLFITGCKP